MEKAESLEGRMGNYDIGNAFLEKIRTISNVYINLIFIFEIEKYISLSYE